ncbi:hypothetical protein BDN70DRAFT_314871 [Pholiota conissans]|uniref:Uncharacterized protein n=1 Tax=Pholiota conissans TaxID=109636 RepID=A0A9P5YV70_9AGAR|nr:hypothetical protein BDN70DRAFT_314871 [Pholiota conissans]
MRGTLDFMVVISRTTSGFIFIYLFLCRYMYFTYSSCFQIQFFVRFLRLSLSFFIVAFSFFESAFESSLVLTK